MDVKNVNELVSTLVSVVLIPVLPVLTGYLIALLRKKTAEAKQKIENDAFDKYITIAEDAVCTSVSAISQTIVDTAKKSGQFTQTAREEAFNSAKEKALTIMGAATQTALKEAYGDLDSWIDSKIEYYVKATKAPG